MTKLKELKASYEAATPGEWEQAGYDDIGRFIQTLDAGEIFSLRRGKFKQIDRLEYRSNAKFIALAHNLMPTLLEAIDLLETVSSARACQDHEFDVDVWYIKVRALLEKLK